MEGTFLGYVIPAKIKFLKNQKICFGLLLGPRPSEENKRAFSEQQLRAGEGLIGLQAGSNKGATQAGQNFGASRKIILGK